MESLILGAVIGAMLTNYDNNDSEWRFQAGYLADYLENGGPMPEGQMLGGICRIAKRKLLSKNDIIQWARSVEFALN